MERGIYRYRQMDKSLPLQALNPWIVLPPRPATSVENYSDFFMCSKFTLLRSVIFKIGGAQVLCPFCLFTEIIKEQNKLLQTPSIAHHVHRLPLPMSKFPFRLTLSCQSDKLIPFSPATLFHFCFIISCYVHVFYATLLLPASLFFSLNTIDIIHSLNLFST